MALDAISHSDATATDCRIHNRTMSRISAQYLMSSCGSKCSWGRVVYIRYHDDDAQFPQSWQRPRRASKATDVMPEPPGTLHSPVYIFIHGGDPMPSSAQGVNR